MDSEAADTRLPEQLGSQSAPTLPGSSQLQPLTAPMGLRPATAPHRHHRAVPQATRPGEGGVGWQQQRGQLGEGWRPPWPLLPRPLPC